MHIAGYPKWFFTPAVQFTMCLIYAEQFWTSLTLPETNIAPENRPSQKERLVFQPPFFRGKLWNFRGVSLKNNDKLLTYM